MLLLLIGYQPLKSIKMYRDHIRHRTAVVPKVRVISQVLND